MKNYLDRLGGWIRWQIAQWMNHYPDTCWAELVMWATYRRAHDFGEIFSMRRTVGGCAAANVPPYCGKCKKGTELSYLEGG